jgi:hypothetical protein
MSLAVNSGLPRAIDFVSMVTWSRSIIYEKIRAPSDVCFINQTNLLQNTDLASYNSTDRPTTVYHATSVASALARRKLVGCQLNLEITTSLSASGTISIPFCFTFFLTFVSFRIYASTLLPAGGEVIIDKPEDG